MADEIALRCNIFSFLYIIAYILFMILFKKCFVCEIIISVCFCSPVLIIIYYVCNDEVEIMQEHEEETSISPRTIQIIESIPDMDVPPSPVITELPQLTIEVCNLNNFTDNTENATYSPMHSPNKLVECVICLSNSPRNMKMLRCKHSFHIKCIQEWMKKEPLCPLCRDPLLS